MHSARIVMPNSRPTFTAALLLGFALFATAPLPAQRYTTLSRPSDSVKTIHAARMIDGRGHLTRDAWVDVRGGGIVRVYSNPTARRVATMELGDVTLMPGLIDAHVHIANHITRNGVPHRTDDGETPAQSALGRAGNLYADLMAGVTTVQSVGSADDLDLREAVNSWQIPGPRVLTAVAPLNGVRDSSLSTDSLRALVRSAKARGADVIKVFAAEGLAPAQSVQTLSDQQLAAICGEARSLRIRTVVHALNPSSIRGATLAGCTTIEHGFFATDDELRLMVAHGTTFDPQVCLVERIYLEYREVFQLTDARVAEIKNLFPLVAATFKRALATPGLKLIFGTDAIPLQHGRNAEELICRVQAGQSTMDAITTATSATAEAMGLGDRIGVIAAGYDADLIAVRGNPVKDINVLKDVVFVMRGGVRFK